MEDGCQCGASRMFGSQFCFDCWTQDEERIMEIGRSLDQQAKLHVKLSRSIRVLTEEVN